MQRYRRVDAPPVRAGSQTLGEEVVLRRESLWLLHAPDDPSQRSRWGDRRGRLVLSAYAVYAIARDVREFEALVGPVLRTLAASRTRAMLVLSESAVSFEAERMRRAVQLARDVGLPTMVEIDDEWGLTQLELVAASGPSYLRLAPEMVRGAATVPDTFRALVAVGEFARRQAIELVARNPSDDQELDALCAAGIGLVQRAALPFDPARSVPARQSPLWRF